MGAFTKSQPAHSNSQIWYFLFFIFFFARRHAVTVSGKKRKAKENPRQKNVNLIGWHVFPWGGYAECLIPFPFLGRRNETGSDWREADCEA
jgi:hypothetical protein